MVVDERTKGGTDRGKDRGRDELHVRTRGSKDGDKKRRNGRTKEGVAEGTMGWWEGVREGQEGWMVDWIRGKTRRKGGTKEEVDEGMRG